MGRQPFLGAVQEPEKLSNLLKEDKPDDCLSCRLIGNLSLRSFKKGFVKLTCIYDQAPRPWSVWVVTVGFRDLQL